MILVMTVRNHSSPHPDAVQSVGGSNITIRNNRLEGPWQAQTSAIIFKADFAPIRNAVIEGNLLSGGTYSLYVLSTSKYAVGGDVSVRATCSFGTRGSLVISIGTQGLSVETPSITAPRSDTDPHTPAQLSHSLAVGLRAAVAVSSPGRDSSCIFNTRSPHRGRSRSVPWRIRAETEAGQARVAADRRPDGRSTASESCVDLGFDRTRGWFLAVALIVTTVGLVATGTSGAASAQRWDGADRYATSVRMSQESFPAGADVVLIATGQTSPDALAAGPAAAALDARPILLTTNNQLPAAVRNELLRLDPSAVYLLGGPSAIGPDVERDRSRTRRLLPMSGALQGTTDTRQRPPSPNSPSLPPTPSTSLPDQALPMHFQLVHRAVLCGVRCC